MLAEKLMGSGVAKTYIEDVFSTYLYTGNGSTQTINNGIDLAGKGGMVWIKRRDSASDHGIYDTPRGVGKSLLTDATIAQRSAAAGNDLSAFNSNGFTVGPQEYNQTNTLNGTFSSWTFRKAPKFFDVVTYTGNGASRTISHSLGQVPGMIIVKRTDAVAPWIVYHRSVGATKYMFLNTTAAATTASTYWDNTEPTSSVFSVGTEGDLNSLGGAFVAYLFAHDTSTDGLIQCGSFTTDGSGNATVNLGWEPQYLLFKTTDSSEGWSILDNMRGWSMTQGRRVNAESSAAEVDYWGGGTVVPTATGFKTNATYSSKTFVYVAIRRGPMKPPTSGTQVYQAIARTGTGAAATVTGVGFPPDLVISQMRSSAQGSVWYDRLRGASQYLTSTATGAEGVNAQGVNAFGMDGFNVGTEGSVNQSSATFINWCMKRYPGVFDEVCSTGDGTGAALSHNLTVVPELYIQKRRDAAGQNWFAKTSGGLLMKLNLTDAATTGNGAIGTASTFNPISYSSGGTYVNYLFATLAGISKVFSYTGNGTSQTINCGFAAGARLVLIKRTDSTGNWVLVDSVRGLVAGSDPVLLLNSTAAEDAGVDILDPASSGFIVNQESTYNLNVNSATYIGLALA